MKDLIAFNGHIEGIMIMDVAVRMRYLDYLCECP